MEKTTIRIAMFSDSSRPHHRNFQALLPSDVVLEYLGNVVSEGETTSAPTVAAARAAEEAGFRGLIVSGAPREVASPTLFEDLRAAVRVPVTTALNAGAAALLAFGAKRALVLTPFDEPVRMGIRDNLARHQIEATVPPAVAGGPPEASGLPAEEVYRLAMDAWEANGGCDAFYFQGAVLDPLPVVDRFERDIGKPVVASNPAMLWYILSQLGRTYHIEGYGRLLREWPRLPAAH